MTTVRACLTPPTHRHTEVLVRGLVYHRLRRLVGGAPVINLNLARVSIEECLGPEGNGAHRRSATQNCVPLLILHQVRQPPYKKRVERRRRPS